MICNGAMEEELEEASDASPIHCKLHNPGPIRTIRQFLTEPQHMLERNIQRDNITPIVGEQVKLQNNFNRISNHHKVVEVARQGMKLLKQED